MNPTGCSTKAQKDGELTREPLVVGSSCKDYFAADVGHVCRRDSVVGSRSRGRARRREGRPRSAIGDEERKRETRRAQNGTQRVTGVLFNCLATYTGMSYILWASRRPCGTYKAGRWLCAPSDSELGTPSSELGVPLGNAEHGGRVAGDLRDTLNVDPNPNGIVPLQRLPKVWSQYKEKKINRQEATRAIYRDEEIEY